jgi:flagellin-like hook-associated protein FlgL
MEKTMLSPAVRATLNSLREISTAMTQAQKRLATGRKVNSAFENPVAFFTASALDARAAALATVLDQISGARKAIETASAGIESVRALIASAQEVARQAQTSADTLAKVSGSISGLSSATSLSFSNGRTITVGDGTTTVTFTKVSGNDVQDFLDAVNASAPLAVTASLTSDGRIQLKADGTSNITIGGTATTSDLATIGLAAGTTSYAVNTVRQSLAVQFDSLRSQIDAVISDASYNGINLLSGGSLDLKFNESGSSTLNIAGSTLSSSSLGVAEVSNGGGDFQLDGEITAALSQLENATSTLSLESARYASFTATVATRQDFTQSMIETLQSGAAELVLADTDAEGALLLALQTRQQIAATALSLSAQGETQALRLFGY